MKESRIILAMHELPGVGWTAMRNMLARCAVQDWPRFTKSDFRSFGLCEQAADRAAQTWGADFIEQCHQRCVNLGIQYVTVADVHEYPFLLMQTNSMPWVLYFKGRWELTKSFCIAMVGTRTPTTYGKQVAAQWSERLSRLGVCIVSGLARGIDSEAHRGALLGGGSTIAILAGPLQQVYPPENQALYRQIGEEGLLLSETPPSAKLVPGLFPRRNRLISGLSRGVVVVEGKSTSGSLITADFAEQENRDVFAVPGSIHSPISRGPMTLIQQNRAKLALSVEDIVDEYPSLLALRRRSPFRQAGSTPLTEEESAVLDLLSPEPVTLDELLARSPLTFGQMHSVLLSLTMKRKVVQLPGPAFVLSI